MPTVLLVKGFRFYFYMNEHLPVHIHVSKSGSRAKFILVPEVELIHSIYYFTNFSHLKTIV